MRNSKAIVSVAILALLSACGTLDKKTILLSVGDSKERVLEVMGTPDDRQVNDRREAWQYCVSGAGFGWNDHKVIWLTENRVSGITSYRSGVPGCQGGIQPVHWETAPDSVVEVRQR